MKLKIRNILKYQFSNPVNYGMQRLRLWPRKDLNQSIINWNIDYVGAKEEAHYNDHHNNRCSLITFMPGVTEITILVRGTVKTANKINRYLKSSEICPSWIYLEKTKFTTPGKAITDFCRFWSPTQLSKIDICNEVAKAIKDEMEYKIGETNVLTTAEESFRKKIGVCQDFTHIFLTCMRQLNIPARYVSGYLRMDESKIQNATHAWAEVFIDKLGWVGFDVANNINVDDQYIILAKGCDYRDANPVNGFQFGSNNNQVTNHIEIKKQRSRNVNQ